MSTIAAGTTSGTALVSTGNTTGELVLQTNGTTTAVTIGTNQVVTLAQPLPVGSGGTGATSLSGLSVGTSTNLAGGSNGTIPYQSAAGTTQMLAVGSAGQLLQTNGAGAPTWVTPSSGALAYLSTTSTAGAASLAISLTAYTATYNAFKIVCTNFYGQTTTANFEVRINNSTSGYISGGGGGRDTQGSGQFGWGARNTSYMMSSYSSTDTLASPSVTVFDLAFYNMNSSSEKWAIGTMVQALKTGSVGGEGVGGVLGGMWINGATPTSINIVSSGSFVATVLLYGIKTS